MVNHMNFVEVPISCHLLVMLVVTVYRKPSTSDGHNFFVLTSFQMFLDSMESPLSIESINI